MCLPIFFEFTKYLTSYTNKVSIRINFNVQILSAFCKLWIFVQIFLIQTQTRNISSTGLVLVLSSIIMSVEMVDYLIMLQKKYLNHKFLIRLHQVLVYISKNVASYFSLSCDLRFSTFVS